MRGLSRFKGIAVSMGLASVAVSVAVSVAMSVSVATAVFGWSEPAIAKTAVPAGFPTIAYEKLPAEAKTTLRLIQQGGPFPYPNKDGTVFGNREQRLPRAGRGYYREYTVPTPGLKHRGARRIVAGQNQEYYYTSDHYQSFARIQLSGTLKLKSLVP